MLASEYFSLPGVPGLQSPPGVPVLPGFAARPFDARTVRRDFPILQERVHGRPLIWLDNAATTQKPNAVIDRLAHFYRHENSNIHRAAHTLAARATDAYESAREKVRRFLNAPSTREIVFVRGTTEGINLVAQSFGGMVIGKDDEMARSRAQARLSPISGMAQITPSTRRDSSAFSSAVTSVIAG